MTIKTFSDEKALELFTDALHTNKRALLYHTEITPKKTHIKVTINVYNNLNGDIKQLMCANCNSIEEVSYQSSYVLEGYFKHFKKSTKQSFTIFNMLDTCDKQELNIGLIE